MAVAQSSSIPPVEETTFCLILALGLGLALDCGCAAEAALTLFSEPMYRADLTTASAPSSGSFFKDLPSQLLKRALSEEPLLPMPFTQQHHFPLYLDPPKSPGKIPPRLRSIERGGIR